MESSSWTHVSWYDNQIRLAVRVRPNCPAHSYRKPVDTASSSGFDTLSAGLSVDKRLSRADGQYSRENIPGSRIGL